MRLAFRAAPTAEARAAPGRRPLRSSATAATRPRRPTSSCALGGDGFMLETLHAHLTAGRRSTA